MQTVTRIVPGQKLQIQQRKQSTWRLLAKMKLNGHIKTNYNLYIMY